MFHRMGHTGHLCLVTKVADIDVKSSTGFVRLWVVNKESLKLVWELNYAVIPIIQGGLLEAIGE
jgi:hypothetical protein